MHSSTSVTAPGLRINSLFFFSMSQQSVYFCSWVTSCSNRVLLNVQLQSNGNAHSHFAPGLSCRHRRAHKYFVESILSDSCKFVSTACRPGVTDLKCDLLPSGEMGYGSERAPGRGEQFLRTNNEPPFCLPVESGSAMSRYAEHQPE